MTTTAYPVRERVRMSAAPGRPVERIDPTRPARPAGRPAEPIHQSRSAHRAVESIVEGNAVGDGSARLHLPNAAALLIVCALVIAGLVGVLMLNTKINENSFTLSDLQVQQSALDLREQQLRSDLAQRESPAHLAEQARDLGLVPAGKTGFVILPSGAAAATVTSPER